jgi:hypothetical protein
MVSAADPIRPYRISRPNFTRTLAQSTSLEHSHKLLHVEKNYMIKTDNVYCFWVSFRQVLLYNPHPSSVYRETLKVQELQ